MSTILTFAKDWIPTLGVLIGAAWVLFRWAREERLRKRREVPALFGTIQTAIVPLNAAKAMLTVEVDWLNTSPYPVFIDPERTRYDLFEVPTTLAIGPLAPKQDLGDPMARLLPLTGMGDFVFEPNSKNQVRGHFVVPRSGVYLIRSKVYREQRVHGDKDFAWTRESVIDTRHPEETGAWNGTYRERLRPKRNLFTRQQAR